MSIKDLLIGGTVGMLAGMAVGMIVMPSLSDMKQVSDEKIPKILNYGKNMMNEIGDGINQIGQKMNQTNSNASENQDNTDLS